MQLNKKILSFISFFFIFNISIQNNSIAQTRDLTLSFKKKDGGTERIKLYEGSYALVIGASNYTEGWPVLPGVKKDVESVRELLEKQGFQVTVVEDPNSEVLRKAFENFINRYGLNPENRLVFYFAGHGHTLKQTYGEDMGYIVPIDAPNPNKDRNGFKQKALDMQLIEVYAKQIESKHALFLFDSCFAGSLFELSRAVPENISYKTTKPVRQFITSGSAEEQVPDRSIFREQFISAITGEGDSDKDGFVTGTELGEFLQKTVVNYSKGCQHPQYGKIRNAKLDKGDFVFEMPKGLGEETIIKSENKISPTPDSSELDNILSEAQRKKNLIKSAEEAFNKAKKIDEMNIGKEDKIKAWDLYLKDYRPADYQIAYAEERKQYWTIWKATTPIPLDEKVNYTETYGELNLDMVWIPGGSFQMGSEDGDDDEKPVHTVELDGFWMGKYEITVAQFKKFVNEMGYKTDAEKGIYTNKRGAYTVKSDGNWGWNESASWKSPGFSQGDNHPVICVSWNDAKAFCKWISEKTGKKYSLPTEAQWEYACRAGSETKYFWGDEESMGEGYINGADQSAKRKYSTWTVFPFDDGYIYTSPVGSFKANKFGIYDIIGNVWEWCEDLYGKDYYSSSSASEKNPGGPTTGDNVSYTFDGIKWEGTARVLRGGSWANDPRGCRASCRSRAISSYRNASLDFRVVCLP